VRTFLLPLEAGKRHIVYADRFITDAGVLVGVKSVASSWISYIRASTTVWATLRPPISGWFSANDRQCRLGLYTVL